MTDSENMIYNLVCDYYETRILMGACRYGELLPSISKIGESFQMAPRTVRAAFSRLEEKGYIRIESRKAAKVIYQVNDERINENAALYFVPRREGMVDFCHSGRLLIEPIWEYAQGSLDQETWGRLKQKLAQAANVDLSVSTRLHIYAFAALQNKLILNFYWELLRYIRFPYLSGYDAHRERDRELLTHGEENDTVFMRAAFEEDFGRGLKRLLAFCSQAEERYGLKGREQIPFRWSVYRQRPQLCYTLVSRIIFEIIKGTYPIGSFLPSLPTMSEQLDVSYRTLRRAVSILNSLGIIHSYQGKGSRVLMTIGSIDFQRPEIREGFRLYRDSLQFMALTVRPVFLYTLEHVEPEERQRLAEKFADIVNRHKCQYCFKLAIDFIRSQCPLATVRECYVRLEEFLVWGYPFVLYRAGEQRLQEEYAQMTWAAAEYLKKGQWEKFADHWKELMEREYEKAGSMLF